MRRVALTLALATLAIGAPPAAAADFWREPDGGPSPINVNGDLAPGTGSSDLVDVGGVPHLAWSESNGSAYQLRVARLEGSEWKVLGPVLNANPTRDATEPRLAVNEGVLWVTWLERDGAGTTTQVRVARRAGNAWAHIGGAVDVYPREDNGGFYAGAAELAFLDGVAYLEVMEDQGTDFALDLLKLNANERWVKADTGTKPGTAIPRGIDLEVSGGRVWLGWIDLNGGENLWRLATNGRDWESVPLVDPDLRGLVEVEDVAGALHLLRRNGLERWTGSAWQPVGPRAPNAFALADVGGKPYLLARTASVGGDLTVLRLNAAGTAWETVGAGQIDNREKLSHPVIAGVGTVPYVAWIENDGCNWEQRVARLETAAADDPALPAPGACPAPPKPPNTEPGPQPNPNPGPNPGPGPGPAPPVVGDCGIRLLGTAGADALSGDAGRNELLGLGGSDKLWGGGHADCLFGGAGNDLLDGGAGNDELSGEAGNDRLKGGADSDELDGGSGNDRLSGNGDEDELAGGSGNDVIAGGDGFDVVNAGAGNDVIDAKGAGFDRINCGPGRDRVKNADRLEKLTGCERVTR